MTGEESAYVRPVVGMTGEMTPKKRAKLLARLTTDVVDYACSNVSVHNLKHTAEMFQFLPLQEIKMEVEQAGITIADPKKKNDKATLVVALVEHIYDDVIEPAESKQNEYQPIRCVLRNVKWCKYGRNSVRREIFYGLAT